MQRLNLKYFIGSFFLSLVAVFIATKAYLVLSMARQQEELSVQNVAAKNIELFAANEENDPIYEKYKKLSAAEAPLGASAAIQPKITVADTASGDVAAGSDEILYASDDSGNWIKGDENYAGSAEDEILASALTESTAVADTQLQIADSGNNQDEELQIADAATAVDFAIPLKHNYKIENGVVSVSDEADNGRIALASQNVSIYNLGTESTADVTEPLAAGSVEEVAENQAESNKSNTEISQNTTDDPWNVAETANKHINKNTYGVKSEPLQQDVTLPDAETSDDKQVAYKLQPNILIPIPEDILNDDNLTPQFSTSKKNLELEQRLRDERQLPELKPEERISNKPVKQNKRTESTIQSIDDEKDFDSDANSETSEEDAETSKKLSDNVAAWFDGVRSKVTGSDEKKSAPKAKKGSKEKHSSIFQRLLGNSDDKNIVPTELKLSFQPNRAEISGQTLDWLHAFADNAVSDENIVVEIRVDRSASYEVQQKRLKLLYKILADNGVEPQKVNIMFTDREPNSFIIRNVRYVTDEQRVEATKHFDNPWN